MDATTGIGLDEQMISEIDAMAKYAVTSGLVVPPKLLEAALRIQDQSAAANRNAAMALARTHDSLRLVVAPATPRTLVLLEQESRRRRLIPWLPSLGPIRVVRQLTVAGLVFLVTFILLGLSPDVNRTSGGILEDSGWTLLLNLLFLLAAAGLGGVFAGLFRVTRYVSQGTYDPKFEATYWIGIVLGLIAGLVLAELVPEAFDTEGTGGSGFQFVRPLLALIGGFSYRVVWRILRKLVDAVESVFRGSADELIGAQAEASRARLANQQIQDRIKIATQLVQLQQTASAGAGSDEIVAQVQSLLGEMLPFDSTAASAGGQASSVPEGEEPAPPPSADAPAEQGGAEPVNPSDETVTPPAADPPAAG